jgi:A-factor type gamma-butyrolactone 1'-reductase (1S-forming)
MDAHSLAGKVALVIGASRGIGAATAAAFVREGACVMLASRDMSAMEQLIGTFPAGSRASAIATDITEAADIERAIAFTVEQFGRLDIAFNNAGISVKRTPFADLSDEVFDNVLATNLRGAFIAMKHEIRAMLKTGGGSIVNTGSIGSFGVMPLMAPYVAAKHGLAGLTKTAAHDHAKQNIRVNMVAAGAVDTAMTRAGILATDEGRRLVEARVPGGRIGTPEQIAEAVVWLSSPAASYVTGAILNVDGGISLA